MELTTGNLVNRVDNVLDFGFLHRSYPNLKLAFYPRYPGATSRWKPSADQKIGASFKQYKDALPRNHRSPYPTNGKGNVSFQLNMDFSQLDG